MKIFLSAVTSQFKECRDALASDLRAIGCNVKVQEDFQQGPRTLIERLENYVASCDRVIALVGEAFGSEADGPAVPNVSPLLSYTQWEYYFAMGKRLNGDSAPSKDSYVYFASSEYLMQHRVAEPADFGVRQRAFADTIKASGKHWGQFDNVEQLCRLVLRDGWQMKDRPSKPHNLPYRSLGSLFKGRDTMMTKLQERLVCKVDDRDVLTPVQVVQGLGGIGKTRLAVEFAWRHQSDFSALLFVGADSAAELRTNIASLTGSLVLNLQLQEDEKEEVRIAAALRWLAENPVWLLIIDNVDNEEAAAEVETLLGRLHGGRVVVTSRITNWSAMVEQLDLDVLSEPDARDFLLARTEKDRLKTGEDVQDASELARELDGLALALEQAGAYVSKRRMRLKDYRRLLQEKTPEVLGWYDPRLMAYKKSVALTWQTTFEQVSSLAKDLLRMLGWLAPDPIPIGLLETAIAETQGGIDALIELEGFSLVRRGPDGATITVHRLVQEITREREQASSSTSSADIQVQSTTATPPTPVGLMSALAALDEAWPDDVAEGGAWQEWTALQPHVAAAVAFAENFRISEPTARLSCGLGALLFNKAVYAEAERLLIHALALDEQVHGSDHPCVGRDLVNLAKVLRETGKLAEAEKCALRSLQISEAANPQNPLAIARALIELGEVLYLQGRLREREPLYRRALSIRERYIGPLHHAVAESMNNLASALQDTGRTAEAERFYRRCLEIGAQVLPANDRELAIWTSNLATLLEETGRCEEAEAAFRNSISIWENGTVPDHPGLATVLLHLALLLDRSERYDEAHSTRLRALNIRSRYFGPSHSSSLSIIFILIRTLFEKGELADALDYCRRLLSSFQVHSDEENLENLNVLANLDHVAILLEGKNESRLAEEYYRTAIEWRERTLGAHHADTISALNCLAKFQERQEDWDAAESTYQKALRQNSENVVILGNYAFLLQNSRCDFQGARAVYEQALEVDPDDAVNLTNFAGLCVCMGDLCTAEELLQKAWAQVYRKPDCYSARTIFLGAAIAVLKQTSPRLFLGQLKILTSYPAAHSQWRMTSLLIYLQDKLSPVDLEFFQALHKAIVDRNATATLDQFSCWQDAEPMALSEQWPETQIHTKCYETES